MAILVVVDHAGGVLGEATARTVAAAVQIGGDIDVLVAGEAVEAVAQQAARLEGVARVWVAGDARYSHQLAEPLAELIAWMGQSYDVIAGSASSMSKSVLPRVAALLDVTQVSEITAVAGPKTFRRSVYAGSAVETVEVLDPRYVVTVRTSAFEPAAERASGAASIAAAPVRDGANGSVFVGADQMTSARPDLSVARVIVSGGRAFASKAQFEEIIGPLADKLKAAIGASRAAVDAGFVANDAQVGQTGRIVAPDLYIACGISGAVQHLAGMKDSKVIVAINKDASAPIFQVADYGLVGDLLTVVPELTAKL